MIHMKAATMYILTKLRVKCRILWEAIAIQENQDNLKIAFLLRKRNPTNINAQKLKTLRELTHSKKNN